MNSGRAWLLILHSDNGERKPETDLVIDPDFDVIEAVFWKLNAAEDMNIGCVGIECGKPESDRGLRDGSVVIAAQHKGFLFKFSGAPTPS